MRTHLSGVHFVWALFLLMFAQSACTGTFEEPAQNNPGVTQTTGDGGSGGDGVSNGASNGVSNDLSNGTSNGATTGMTGGTTGGTTTDIEDPPKVCDVRPTPLRRLSHFEYQNTVTDLFPDAALPSLDLPADNRPHEFDNDADGLVPSPALVERYMEVSRGVIDALDNSDVVALSSCTPSDASPGEAQRCGEVFVREQGQRLFRRPLADEEVTLYSALFTAEIANATYPDRLKLTLQLMLSAPEFLYRFERPEVDVAPGASAPMEAYALANRLSYFLWGSMPDEALFAAAADGSIAEPETLREHAERMMDSPKRARAFGHFHSQWLHVERLDRVTKREGDRYTPEMRASMKAQAELFVDRVLYEEEGTLRDLLTSPRTFVDANLAPLYGVDAPEDGWIEIDDSTRAGFLTQPAFLASHGHPDKPSPVLRGVFVLERLMCVELGSPPPNAEAQADALEDELEGPLTNRQFYELVTSDPTCTSCHKSINPVGAAFENYDTMGRFQTEEPNGLTIDSSASLGEIDFENAIDFVHQIADTEQAESCMVKKWVRYTYAGGPAERASCFVDELRETYKADGGSIRDLQLAIVTHPWFATFQAPEEDTEE